MNNEINMLATRLAQELTPEVSDASRLNIIRRNGELTAFNPTKITVAITKAYIAVNGTNFVMSDSVREQISHITSNVIDALLSRYAQDSSIHIENIQDQVELALMRNGDYEVAKAYVIYREDKARERAMEANIPQHNIHVTYPDGRVELLDSIKLFKQIKSAMVNLVDVEPKLVLDNAIRNLYDGVKYTEVEKSLILASRQQIEYEPNYNFVTARLLLDVIRYEAIGREVSFDEMEQEYKVYFPIYLQKAIDAELVNPELARFDLTKIVNALDHTRDLQFKYLGLQTLYDRYFIHIRGRRIELPQVFFMRVAMGLAINEANREDRAIEFYNLLSSFDFMSSTPTLFNSGTMHSQLSSCYLSTVSDDLVGIYDAIKDNALLSKFAGGLGNDWTPVRAMGALIKGTNGNSQGVIPFLKVVNDTCVAVNQGGKRKGAACVYLESWHADIEEFMDLRKNTGDDRRRCHDINTANWIPDLFMRRVHEQGNWSLFSPNEAPDLHDKYGKAFEEAYVKYEEIGRAGKLSVYKEIPALQLWRKMLTMLFETGHPWINFKDPCNLRSPQQHMGVVHSSNLCTEITLNTNADEIAVCNLGSINLVNHIRDGKLDSVKLQRTVQTAVRMLDNVIDINFYPVDKARNSNLKHRPVGLGFMGFQDALHQLQISYASQEAVDFADQSMEAIAYYAYLSSSNLAAERGRYSSYDGSLWSQGVLPLDSIDFIAASRGEQYLQLDRSSKLDWDALRATIQTQGMRNSNVLAIAPTATISNIIGVSASIEPNYQNIFVKSNLSGEFTVINEYLVNDLKKLKMWDDVMIADIKYFDGSLLKISRIPDSVKQSYLTAFEIDASWLVEAAARRQKWIDQSQSLNIYMAQASGRKLDEIYKLAWIRGLKTTYYLRTLAATAAEKSTGSGGELNAVSAGNNITSTQPEGKFCSIDNPECESCQ